MTKRPDTKKRISLGVSDKKAHAAMDYLLGNAKKRTKKAARPQRAVKVEPKPARKIFVYAEDLLVGDVIELHSSVEWKPGHWRNESVTGPVLSIDKETNRLYSKTLVMVEDQTWADKGGASQQHSLSNMSYIHLVKAAK